MSGNVKRLLGAAILSAAFFPSLPDGGGLPPAQAKPPPAKPPARRYPRIEKAIHELTAALTEMKHAPPIFDGHRARAIVATEIALRELRAALQYRRMVDGRPTPPGPKPPTKPKR